MMRTRRRLIVHRGRRSGGDRPQRVLLGDRSHVPGDLAGMSIIGLKAGNFLKHRSCRIDLPGVVECLSSPSDPAGSEQDETSIEVRQGQQRRPCLITIRSLIEPLTQSQDSLGDRLELLVGRLLGMDRQDVDAGR